MALTLMHRVNSYAQNNLTFLQSEHEPDHHIFRPQ